MGVERPEDLESLILAQTQALSLCPTGHPDRPISLARLAYTLKRRYEQRGDVQDLESMLSMEREAKLLCPADHPKRSMFLLNLAYSLGKKYERFGDMESMDEMISLEREALHLCPSDHQNRSISLNNLAYSLKKRFERSGAIEDLEGMMSMEREALHLCPPDHPNRATCLLNLASSLKIRYDLSRGIEDLEEAISMEREALLLRPPGHANRPRCLTNLACSLRKRYDRFQDAEDLDELMSLDSEALLLCPPDHPDRSIFLIGLGASLSKRYQQSGDANDLERMISTNQEALLLCPPGHPSRSNCLINLAYSLKKKHDLSGDLESLETVISTQKEAVLLCPPGHPNRSISFANLASSLGERTEKYPARHDDSTLREIQDYCLEAIKHPFSSIALRFDLATQLAKQPFSASFRCTIYTLALGLLQRLLIIHPDIMEQQSKLVSILDAHSLASNAASLAIASGDIALAISLLDQGRSLLLDSLHRYRTPLGDLRTVSPALASKLQSTGAQLERLSTFNQEEVPLNTPSRDYAFNTQRKLLGEMEALLGEIRSLPNFDRFLLPPTYENLKAAATDGPIIVLNPSEERCDAIIVNFEKSSSLVPLPDISIAKLKNYSEDLVKSRRIRAVERATILKILRLLWREVVAPIVERLSSMGIPTQSRVWWIPCASFSTLPWHAAGLYDGKSPKSDFPSLYISSYTSTLSGLLRVKPDNRIHDSTAKVATQKLLFVGHTGGNLTKIGVELSVIQSIKRLNTEAVLEEEATQKKLLDKLPRYPWAHFSCHGVVLPEQPLNSYFQLEEWRLPVKDIIGSHLSDAEFAFLSACHSAAAGDLLPDESIHLAGALQFAGFRSVIGTMWEMYDSEGPAITKDFYRKLIQSGGRYTDAAGALHHAIRRCAKNKLGPERWAMFIHIGA